MIQAALQKVNVTPPIGTPLGGYAARKSVSQGIHDDLYATAMLLQREKDALVIVTADLIGFPREVVEQIRKAVQKYANIPPTNVLIAASHTHSGPDLLFGHQGLASRAYVEVLIENIVGAIYATQKKLHPVEIGVGQGRLEGLGVNRRTFTGVPVDPSVGVLRVDCNKKPEGILINYTCHPVVLGPDNLLITADYPGYALRIIERVLEGKVIPMFTNGAAGDINVGHSAELSAIGEKIPGRTFERAEKLGLMLAGEVLKTLAKIESSQEVLIATASKDVFLPLKPLPSLEEVKALVQDKEKALNELVQKGASAELVAKAKIEKLYADILFQQVNERQQKPKELNPVELQAIRIGNCALITFPGELLVEIGLKIKEQSPFQYTYVIGYANGYVGYLPTKQAFEEGGYEAVASHFAPESEEIVIEESLELLRSLV
jgi:hypothetical protein